jgi:hypothetical protein
MIDEILEGMRAELDQWRARVDHLRVQANLGGKEARDKLRELEKQLAPAVRDARKRLDEVATGGTAEAKRLVQSLRAGWDELKRTHRELADQAEHESRS